MVEVNSSIYIFLDFCYDCVFLFVYDGIDFFYNIKVGFIVCVFYVGFFLGYIR